MEKFQLSINCNLIESYRTNDAEFMSSKFRHLAPVS